MLLRCREIYPQSLGVDLGGSLTIIRARCIRPLRHHIDIVDNFVPQTRQIPFVAPEYFLGAPLTTAFDIWSAACVFVSMIMSAADYPIYSEHHVGQLFEIFRMFGTPTEHTWPGVTALPHYSPAYPKYAPRPLRSVVSEQVLDDVGFDLLSRMWVLDPSKRITAAQALHHAFFTR
jgi:cyclin-dependent kinase 2